MKTEAVLSFHAPFSTEAPVPALPLLDVARPTSPVEAVAGFVLLTFLSLPGAVVAWLIAVGQ